VSAASSQIGQSIWAATADKQKVKDLYCIAPPQACCTYILVHSVVISEHSGEPLDPHGSPAHFRYRLGTTEREKKRYHRSLSDTR
jgi:hypothetical protein